MSKMEEDVVDGLEMFQLFGFRSHVGEFDDPVFVTKNCNKLSGLQQVDKCNMQTCNNSL